MLKFGEGTYNPSVNSRNGCSRLALQTLYLDARKTDYHGIWVDFGGTPRRFSGASLQKAGVTARSSRHAPTPQARGIRRWPDRGGTSTGWGLYALVGSTIRTCESAPLPAGRKCKRLTGAFSHATIRVNVTEVRNGIRVDRLEESGKAPELRL